MTPVTLKDIREIFSVRKMIEFHVAEERTPLVRLCARREAGARQLLLDEHITGVQWLLVEYLEAECGVL